MVETANLGLPLLSGGQASKHVTMNEALSRIDALMLLSVKSWTVTAPPGAPEEGDRYVVPVGAVGGWAGRDGAIAVRVNGGWDYIAPRPGWRTFVEDEGGEIVFSLGTWLELIRPFLAVDTVAQEEFEHVLTAGGAQSTAGLIPAGSLLFGVSARVLDPIIGVDGWSLGVDGAPTRYGTGLPVTGGAPVTGATGTPLAYPVETPLVISPEGGDFAGGRVRFRLHFLLIAAPAV